MVLAGADHTGITAGNTADIRHRIGSFCAGQAVDGDIRQFHCILHCRCINLGLVFADPDNTFVLTCDTAYKVTAVDVTPG